MGRIEVPLQRLQQWQCSIPQLIKIIASLLSIEYKAENFLNQSNLRIGMLKGSKGRRWISLNTNPLSLEINNQIMPLEEMLYFENDQLVIDKYRINEQLNNSRQNQNKIYIPSTSKREKSKRKTQAMYQNWKDEYLTIKKQKPGQSDVWYSKQIARKDIAQGRDSETIRSKMK
jgi:hypothetical protein